MKLQSFSYPQLRNSVLSYQPKHISFGNQNQYSKPLGNVIIKNDPNVREEVVTGYGDINATNSSIKGTLKGVQGNINLDKINMQGEVSVLAEGNITARDSDIKGDVSTKKGDITAEKTAIYGDIMTGDGTIRLSDVTHYGKIAANPGRLELTGKNKLQDVIFIERKQPTIHIGSMHVSNGVGIDLGDDIKIGGDVHDLKIFGEHKAPEFKLPKGTTITGILKFDSEKVGTLLVEEGAVFAGKIINGVVKYLH